MGTLPPRLRVPWLWCCGRWQLSRSRCLDPPRASSPSLHFSPPCSEVSLLLCCWPGLLPPPPDQTVPGGQIWRGEGQRGENLPRAWTELPPRPPQPPQPCPSSSPPAWPPRDPAAPWHPGGAPTLPLPPPMGAQLGFLRCCWCLSADTRDCGSVFFFVLLALFLFVFPPPPQPPPISFLKYRGRAPQPLVTFPCWEFNLFASVSLFFTLLSPPVPAVPPCRGGPGPGPIPNKRRSGCFTHGLRVCVRSWGSQAPHPAPYRGGPPLSRPRHPRGSGGCPPPGAGLR